MSSQTNIYLYIFVMAAATYLVRMLPLTLLRRQVTNPVLRSFLYYVPYVTLAVMTFPAILGATKSLWSALAGFAAASLLALKGKGLLPVAAGACAVVFLAEIVIC